MVKHGSHKSTEETERILSAIDEYKTTRITQKKLCEKYKIPLSTFNYYYNYGKVVKPANIDINKTHKHYDTHKKTQKGGDKNVINDIFVPTLVEKVYADQKNNIPQTNMSQNKQPTEKKVYAGNIKRVNPLDLQLSYTPQT